MNICVPEGTTLYLIETLDLECNFRNYISNDLNYATKELEKFISKNMENLKK